MTATETFSVEQLHDEVAQLRGQVAVGGEVQTLTDGGVIPSAPAAGSAAIYSNGGQPSWVDPAGMVFGMTGTQKAFYPANTVTGTSLSNLAAFTIRAGGAVTNSMFEVECWGNGTWGSTQRTLQFAVMLGGNTMSSVTLGALFMAASQAFRFRVAVRAICQTTGGSGTWTSLICGEVSAFGQNLLAAGGSSANASNGFTSCESSGTTTVDTTANADLGLSAAWGGTTCTVTSTTAIAKRLC